MKKVASLFVGVAVLLCVIVAASLATEQVRGEYGQQRRAHQRAAIERAAVLCYALEGAYPSAVTYLEDHYGLILDRKNFIIHYRAYGANLRPEIEVYAYE